MGEDSEISIPYAIDTIFVNAIGDNILLESSNVEKINIHGNINVINTDAFDEGSIDVLGGYNGTYVQKYAEKQGIKFDNLSADKVINHDGQVTDVTYTKESDIEFQEKDKLLVIQAVAAGLETGDIIFVSVDGEEFFYEVISKTKKDDSWYCFEIKDADTTIVDGLNDGNWVYEIIDDYAVVKGYLDYSVTE